MSSQAAIAVPEPVTRPVIAPATVALLGNPNTGKTTVFNRLCGARAKTSNYPGTTTSTRTGRCDLGDRRLVEVVDLPGVYDLRLDAVESRIARLTLLADADERPDAVVVVVDACNLSRNLMLTGELLATGVPVIVALNMVDLAQRRGLTLDAAQEATTTASGTSNQLSIL